MARININQDQNGNPAGVMDIESVSEVAFGSSFAPNSLSRAVVVEALADARVTLRGNVIFKLLKGKQATFILRANDTLSFLDINGAITIGSCQVYVIGGPR